MKSILLSLALSILLLASEHEASAQQQGFYSINWASDSLVFFDTTGAINYIGPIGRDVASKYVGLTYYDDTLFLSMRDTLYQVNTQTGLATPLFWTYNASNFQGIRGSISVDANDVLYLFEEPGAFAEGKLYTVNRNTGASLRVSGNTSGDPSILAIAFDDTVLYGVSELNDQLLKINVSTGVVDYYFSPSIGMSFTTAITNVNGNLWGFDITNETVSDSTRLNYIDKTTGLASWRYTFPFLLTGLAYGVRDSTVGINKDTDQQNDFNITFYPNPNHGILKFKFPLLKFKNANMDIFDVTGRNIYSNEFVPGSFESEQSISLKNLALDGFLIVKLNIDNNTWYKKVIIQK